MNSINKEIYLVQNPSISAAILWRFICGYYGNENSPTPFPLLFLVLPIIFRQDLCEVIKSTQRGSGLIKVSEKLFSERKDGQTYFRNDLLYSVHNAVNQYKHTSLSAIGVGLATKLFVLDTKTALLFPLTTSKKTGISASTKTLLDSAEKLGAWCSELTLHEISKLLKVRF
jgi:hypothetical protein